MTTPGPQLTEAIDVGPGIDAETWRLALPGRAACYLLEDGDGRSIIAATVGDLRSALVRRLGPDPEPVPGEQTHRKIDYRAVTRRVRWHPVFSRFEGNWTYLELVRDRFPQSYRKLIRPWRAWWLGVDERDPHPRFEVTDKPYGPPETCFGPFPTQKAGRRHAQMLEDLFDLCRYHHILVQAPHAQACAYKQMGRCPAPCDGTVTMDAYRAQIASAIEFMGSEAVRSEWSMRMAGQMQQAAADRDYERAARCKSLIETTRAAYRAAGPAVCSLDRFRFVSFQRGDRKGRVRVFVITPGAIEFAGQIEKANRDQMLRDLAARIEQLRHAPAQFDVASSERIGLVAWHLIDARREQGLFVSFDALNGIDAAASVVDGVVAGSAREPTEEESNVDDVSSESDASAP